MTNSKGTRIRQRKFCSENEEAQSNKNIIMIKEVELKKKEYILLNPNSQDNTKKSDKCVQVNFDESSLIKKRNEKLAPIEENILDDFQLEPPPKIEKKESVNVEPQKIIKNQEDNSNKTSRPKHKSTYDPSVFRTYRFEHYSGRFKQTSAPPIKLNVTLKDIGMEGFDSYKQEKVEEPNKKSPSKVVIKETEDDDKLREEMIQKKVQEEWEIRKKIEKGINTYDPKIFQASAFSPSKKPNPEELPPVKLNVELKDIGLDGLDSYKQEKTQEIKPNNPPKKVAINTVDEEKLREEMIQKKVQEEWKIRKEVERTINTYDPKIFRASSFSPSKKPKPEEIPPIKLTVDLKDIGFGEFDPNKEEKPEEPIKKSPSKVLIKETEDNEQLREEMIRKKVQEEWEIRKKIEKETYTYDPRIFRASAFSPSKKPNPDEIPPVKLNVELKDIGLDGFDSYNQEKPQEIKQIKPPKKVAINTVDEEKLREEMIQKKVQEEWKIRKEVERTMNTYDPKIFRASSFSPSKKPKPEEIPPIKLTVDLKDIGFGEFDPNKEEKPEEPIKKSPSKAVIKETEDNEQLREEMIQKKVQEEWEIRKKIEKETYTYDPKIFQTSAFSPSKKPNPEEIPPVKLNVELKDIGLEGLDSYNQEKPQEIKPPNPRKKVVFTPVDQEKLREEMIQKKVQEEWELRKAVEKTMNTYDPKLFRDSSCSPTKKLKPEEIPPVKLKISLKDIGMEGFDSYPHENEQEHETKEPDKIEKEDNKEKEFEIKQPTEASTHSNIRTKRRKNEDSENINTYDRRVFDTSFFEARKERENIRPIRLKISLKDIGLEGLDSYKQENSEDTKIPHPPPEPEDPLPSQTVIMRLDDIEPTLNAQKKSNAKIQKIYNNNNNNSKRKTEKKKRKSTYDPSVFYTSSCAFSSAQFTAKNYGPIKLKVTLKDIGLDGLDSI